jgi:hypothetical protein
MHIPPLHAGAVALRLYPQDSVLTYLMPALLLTPFCQLLVKEVPPTWNAGMVTNSTPAGSKHRSSTRHSPLW